MQTPKFVVFTLAAGVVGFLAGCAETPPVAAAAARAAHGLQHVRTTAYTGNEGSGHHNAIGSRLSGGNVMSAAADWSRFPLGTRFRIPASGDVYQIDDYGGALIGTNTIDLYKASRASMHAWGVRYIDIQVLEWGSDQQSLRVLAPRSRSRIVRRMVSALEQKSRTRSTLKTL